MRVLFSKLSAYRNRTFAQKTVIASEGGKKIVMKQPLYEEGLRHFEEVCENRKNLVQIFPDMEINNVYMENGTFYSEFVEDAVPLSVFYAEAVKNSDKERFLELVDLHINLVTGKNNTCKFYETPGFSALFGDGSIFAGELALSNVNFDSGSGNILFRNGDFKKPVLIDFERFYDFPVPKTVFYYTVLKAGVFGVNITGIYDDFISLEEALGFICKKHFLNIDEQVAEQFFQKYVSGIFVENDGSPVNGILNKYVVKEKWKPGASIKLSGTFYFDTGRSFNEAEKIHFTIQNNENILLQEIQLPENTINVRFDPVENAACVLHELEIISPEGFLDFSVCNGFEDGDKNIVFLNEDPQILIPGTKGINRIKIKCGLFAFSDFEHYRFVDNYLNKLRSIEELKSENEISLSNLNSKFSKALFEKESEYNQILSEKESEYKQILSEKENKYNQVLSEKESEYNQVLFEKESECNKLEEEKNYYILHYNAAINQREELSSQNKQLSNNYNAIQNAAFWKLTKPARVTFNATKKIPFIRIGIKTLRYIKNYGFRAALHKITSKGNNRKKLSEINSFTDSDRKFQENYKFNKKIKFSVLVPLYNTPENFLKEMIESVIFQTYPDWELCLADGSDIDYKISEKICRNYEKKDKRIKYRRLEKNLGISGNTNACIDMSAGEYICLFDHDDILHPSALFENMKAICDKEADFIYSDEDKTSDGKDYFDPHFKPDFAVDNLRGNNYICHFTVFKKDLLDTAGKFNPEFDGSQDHDLIFRLTENAENIVHIPKILYHWRVSENSVASDPYAKKYAITAGIGAVESHLKRCDLKASVESSTVHPNIYRIKYEIKNSPLVSILIPNKDHIDDLKKCLDSVKNKSTYKNYEIIIIENNSENEETFNYYRKLSSTDKIKIVTYKEKFNYSAINNFGAGFANGEYLILLNNDIEIISPSWIEEMLMYCQRGDVGAAGAMLYYSDNTIQHAGVGIGILTLAGHYHKHFPRRHPGYMGRLSFAQDVSAVTGACMMVKRKVFDKIKGLNEDFEVAFNDIDLCMRIRKAGYLIIWTPYAECFHYESKSRGNDDTPEKQRRFQNEVMLFQKTWKKELEDGDPYYNINLTLDKEDFGLR